MSEQPHEKIQFAEHDVDLEIVLVLDSQGRRIDADYVDRAVADVRARRGRPSLSGDDGPSEHVSFRVPEQTRRLLDERARKENRRPSDVAREALDRYLGIG